MSSGETPPTRHTCLTLSLVILLIVMGGVAMGILYGDNIKLQHRLDILEGEMLVIREMVRQVTD